MEREFEKTLDLYRKNLVEYKVSGNAAYKVASDTAKKWLDDSLKTMETTADKNKKEIEDFVKNYDKSDTELASLKKEMRSIRKEGPELQVLYETEHKSQKEEEVEIDFTTYYTKGAVLMGVIGLAAVASFI
jgi:PDZ domain-containing secreted protein